MKKNQDVVLQLTEVKDPSDAMDTSRSEMKRMSKMLAADKEQGRYMK